MEKGSNRVSSDDHLFDGLTSVTSDKLFEFTLPNINLFFGRIPEHINKNILNEIKSIQSNFNLADGYHEYLAGHLQHEYNLDNCIPVLEDYILNATHIYINKYGNKVCPDILTRSVKFKLNDLWVNFQKKYEFNPPHYHGGVISFVIWMKIPYDLNQETKIFKSKNKQTSKFNLIYNNILGSLSDISIPIDKEYEGIICFFPSKLTHSVNPFYTSDDYRISVSGNVSLDVDSTL
jgi:hypothetical protein